ncbi:hypothetical protein GLAREA_12124 [Glarea lozoyensis ATCC 20868]|uniref:Uncharacterized protein n=1 Tax=Glarea lozoyensis (strain ATCC 20868 / MF5171) TaxID=1116229 RepID=S3D0I1_GLAL2|nr:uncharacterized protein GLAREA_12124 [Glarea lozoyensis ATCC 20868]EPE32042.1 hypothetical protein GLAREA_12124 [Glarea lozoyensis ATCC 20868]
MNTNNNIFRPSTATPFDAAIWIRRWDASPATISHCRGAIENAFQASDQYWQELVKLNSRLVNEGKLDPMQSSHFKTLVAYRNSFKTNPKMVVELNEERAQAMCVWLKHFFALEMQRSGRTDGEVPKKKVQFSFPVEDQNPDRKEPNSKEVVTREPRSILRPQYQPFFTTQRVHRDYDATRGKKLKPQTKGSSENRPHSNHKPTAHNGKGASTSGKSTHQDHKQSSHTRDHHSANAPAVAGSSRPSNHKPTPHNREGSSTSDKSPNRHQPSGHKHHSPKIPAEAGSSRQRERRPSSHTKAKPSSNTIRENPSRRPSTGRSANVRPPRKIVLGFLLG